ncbi:MAG TPA: hypothetical protein VLV15_12550 [Dongiaceae bacterium]|nr:hypothetical protein [Dongiaceae bacterium]
MGGMADPIPPLDPLLGLIATLDHSGVACVLGGSGLLHALGLVDRVRDWDLQTDASEDEVRTALAGYETTHHGNDALHADSKFGVPVARAEVICRFAFYVPAGVVRLPVIVSGAWCAVPLASLEVWAVAYALLAAGERSPRRLARSERLFSRLAERGADPAAVRTLLAQPLPPPLAARLAALPPRG